MRSRVLSLGWIVVILCLSAWLLVRLSGEPGVRTDLMALLPVDKQDPTISAVISDFQKRFERRVVLLVSAPDVAAAQEAATFVYEAAKASGRFETIQLRHEDSALQDVTAFYFALRYQLLSQRTRDQLTNNEWGTFERDVLARYYSPVTPLTSDLIRTDPMLLLPDALGERLSAAAGRLRIVDGYLQVADSDGVHILIVGALNGSPFAFDLQADLASLFERLRVELPDMVPGASLLVGGVLPHAIAGTQHARAEISLVGTGSTIGVIILFLLAFRSLTPLLLSLFSIAVGMAAGYAACILLFGGMHLITLVFGTGLIGISVDYSLHFFCERFGWKGPWSADRAMKRILPSITLGLITSLIGFMALFPGPFPGMREMAVFFSFGLVFAYANVVLLYPVLAARAPAPRSNALLNLAGAYGVFWQTHRLWLIVIVGLSLAVGVLGISKLEFSDDVRSLQPRNAEVASEQSTLARIVGYDASSQFLIVRAGNDDELLRSEEALTTELRALERDGVIEGHLAISDLFPSADLQQQDRQLVARLLDGDVPTLDNIAHSVGIPDDVIQSYVAGFEESEAPPPPDLADWLANPASAPFRDLYVGGIDDAVYSVVNLNGVRNIAALRAGIEAMPFVRFIDPPAEISDLFSNYRYQVGWLILASYGLIAVALAFRYGVTGTLLVMIPPVIGTVVALGVIGLFDEGLSLFHVMALLLVLGVGIDYGIFCREKGHRSARTQLAIGVSFISNVLGFGLLSFSTTAAIHAFGLTVFVGVTTAWLLSPIASAWHAAPMEEETA